MESLRDTFFLSVLLNRKGTVPKVPAFLFAPKSTTLLRRLRRQQVDFDNRRPKQFREGE
jgi:hypothetical protein